MSGSETSHSAKQMAANAMGAITRRVCNKRQTGSDVVLMASAAIPAPRELLEQQDEAVEHEPDRAQHRIAEKIFVSLHARAGKENQVAEPGIGGDELGDDDTGDRHGGGDLEPAEEVRHGETGIAHGQKKVCQSEASSERQRRTALGSACCSPVAVETSTGKKLRKVANASRAGVSVPSQTMNSGASATLGMSWNTTMVG